MKQIYGYEPASARRGMMTNADEESSEEKIEDGVELEVESRALFYLKELIKEHVRGVVVSGLRRASLQDIVKNYPDFYKLLQTSYGDMLPRCTVALRTLDAALARVPYVLLPDSSMTVVYWDAKTSSPVYSQSEALARALEKFSSINEIIRSCDNGKFCLYTKRKDKKTGKRRRLGTHSSRASAERQERAIKANGG
jgi:hypothetical protein